MTEKDKRNKEVTKKTKKFMKSVKTFLASKSGGEVPAEWECSLMLLEEYYKQFCYLTIEIDNLESMVSMSRYGEQPNPLLGARDRAAVRLESIMKSLGLTLKSALTMEIAEPVVEDSPLESFVKNKIERRDR